MMNHEMISELVAWIETQLTAKLTIDDVASRAGYSKWHLQRTYMNSTGVTLGEYIRRRQLSCAATELVLTRSDVIYIAIKYGFSSQQTFTRAFSNYFGEPPARYRKLNEWDCSQLFPPFHKTIYPASKPELVSMPSRVLYGIVNKFPCDLEKLDTFNMNVRNKLFRRHLRENHTLPKKLWGLSEFHSNPNTPGIVDVHYITAIEGEGNPCKCKNSVKITIPAGYYLQFFYNGEADGFQNFILDVNRIHLPKLRAVRRKGLDLELFSLSEENGKESESEFIKGSYFVPLSETFGTELTTIS